MQSLHRTLRACRARGHLPATARSLLKNHATSQHRRSYTFNHSYRASYSCLVQVAGMQRRRLLCCLLFWLAATSCCAADKKQKPKQPKKRELDLGGVPLDVGYREQEECPSPRCCMGGSCAAPKTGKHAFVTSVRTAQYVPTLKQLVCSLAESNPGQLLIVMGCEGDNLTDKHKQSIRDLSSPQLTVQYRTVPNINITNEFSPRFGLNWIKLNSWNMTEFDTIINLDTDMAVLGDLTHLRTLPTDFAWVPWQAPHKWWHNKGGFVFLRPCRAVYEHMVGVATKDQRLQFHDVHAEQTFFEWYFHYTSWHLPMEYNTNSVHGIDKIDGNKLFTIGGTPPFVLHFANIKPWNIKKEDEMWRFANRCKDTPKQQQQQKQEQKQQQRKPNAQTKEAPGVAKSDEHQHEGSKTHNRPRL